VQQSSKGAIFLPSRGYILSVSPNIEFNEKPMVFLQSLGRTLSAKPGRFMLYTKEIKTCQPPQKDARR